MIRSARELALKCLLDVSKHHYLIPEAMGKQKFELKEEDRNLAHEIAYGTLRYLPWLEQVLGEFCKRPNFPEEVRWILLTGFYQIGFMRVPEYAVVDEANRLAERVRMGGMKRLINGVLRNALRRGPELWEGAESVRGLLPEWLGLRLKKQYGAEVVESWVSTWREKAPQSYWTMTTPLSEEDVKSDCLPHAWRRPRLPAANALKEARAYVQNESSQALAELVLRLGAKRVLDLCAAPGGKSCYMAAFGENLSLLANDPDSERVIRMRENRERLGLNFEIAQQAGDEVAAAKESFDLVLVDAPCSGLGIIGRHPEIKFLRKQGADHGLRALQARLIETGLSYVKPGGWLLYSVCSLDQEELPDVAVELRSDAWKELLPAPAIQTARGFAVPPSSIYDGFVGQLLRKPE